MDSSPSRRSSVRSSKVDGFQRRSGIRRPIPTDAQTTQLRDDENDIAAADDDEGDDAGMVGASVGKTTTIGEDLGGDVDGACEGRSVGDGVVKDKSTNNKGHEDTGPNKGFKYKQEQSSMDPSLVGTLTRSPDRAHTTKSLSANVVIVVAPPPNVVEKTQ
jgi:hypothetical protein